MAIGPRREIVLLSQNCDQTQSKRKNHVPIMPVHPCLVPVSMLVTYVFPLVFSSVPAPALFFLFLIFI